MIYVGGIDPSLTGTGVAFVASDGRKIATDVISSYGKRDDDLDQRRDRIRGLAGKIVAWMRARLPEVLEPGDRVVFIIEAPLYGPAAGGAGTGSHQHDRSGLWWLLLQILGESGAVVEVAPTVLKKYITLSGGAKKGRVLACVHEMFPHVFVVDHNAADAISLAALAARKLGFPLEPEFAKVHVPSLASVPWPASLLEAAQ
jgi:crossover junction endodeoxyribonuclease RuvC